MKKVFVALIILAIFLNGCNKNESTPPTPYTAVALFFNGSDKPIILTSMPTPTPTPTPTPDKQGFCSYFLNLLFKSPPNKASVQKNLSSSESSNNEN
jgi:nitrous oxide reductase accessory protein NosL